MAKKINKNYFETSDFKLIGRNDILWMAVFGAILAGFLFPWSATLFDILLIFCLCLSAGILIIVLLAKSAEEATGFPLMLLLSCIFHFISSIAGTKLFFVNHNISKISSWIADNINNHSLSLILPVFLMGSVIFIGYIFKNLQRIIKTANKYFENIVPEIQLDINCELEAGLINNQQAFSLKQELNRCSSFFIAVSGISRFFIFIIFIQLAFALVSIAGAFFTGIQRAVTDSFSTSSYIREIIACHGFIFISVLISASATAGLVKKCFKNLKNPDEKEHFEKRISIIAKEIINASENKIPEQKQYLKAQNGQTVPDSDRIEEKVAKDNIFYSNNIKSDLDFDKVTEKITSMTEKGINLITIGNSSKSLPVTIPVNIAIRLAKKGQKVLIADKDQKRNAVFKVFDKDAEEFADKITDTFVDNLFITKTGANLSKSEISNYDHIITYFPEANETAKFHKIENKSNMLALFGDAHSNKDKLIKIEKKHLERSWNILSAQKIIEQDR